MSGYQSMIILLYCFTLFHTFFFPHGRKWFLEKKKIAKLANYTTHVVP